MLPPACTAVEPLVTVSTSPVRRAVSPVSSEAMPFLVRVARPLCTWALTAASAPSNQPRCRPAKNTAPAAMRPMTTSMIILYSVFFFIFAFLGQKNAPNGGKMDICPVLFRIPQEP